MQERRNSSASAIESRLSCNKLSKCKSWQFTRRFFFNVYLILLVLRFFWQALVYHHRIHIGRVNNINCSQNNSVDIMEICCKCLSIFLMHVFNFNTTIACMYRKDMSRYCNDPTHLEFLIYFTVFGEGPQLFPWPKPKQWLMINMTDLMFIIRIKIFSQSLKKNVSVDSRCPIYCIKMTLQLIVLATFGVVD